MGKPRKAVDRIRVDSDADRILARLGLLTFCEETLPFANEVERLETKAECLPATLERSMMRMLLQPLRSLFRRLHVLAESSIDSTFLDPDVPIATTIGHQQWRKYLYDNYNKPGIKILEIGSREVTGTSTARAGFSNAEYTGMDYYPGDNVDIVGDAHKLSSYFKNGEKFDLIYSSACFEHFAMPWVVAVEISKLLKIGGVVFVETHFSWSSHERPWHFFQFSDMALKVLFSKALGFECIEAGASNPMVGRFSSLADDYLKNKKVTRLYCHSEYLGRKIRDVDSFDWAEIDLSHVVEETVYPPPIV